MEIDLTGKSALVGGSTGGIGKAIATRLAASGASVCLMARNKSKLEKVVNELDKSRNQKHGFLEVDFSNYKLFSTKIKSFFEKNQIDILVNNAGTSSASPLEEMTNEHLTEDLNLKVYGAIFCARAVIDDMKSNGSGSIINITTPGGKATAGGSQPTSLSRAAGISLTKAWSKEYAAQNIRVNTVCVGLLKSGQHRTRVENIQKEKPDYTLEDHWEVMGKNVPMGRVGEAIEVGNVICFLSSSKASYVTGTAINVDGGTSPVV